MDVALDGTDDDGAEHLALLVPRDQHRLEHLHGGLHGLGGHDQVGDEVLATLEAVADDLHAGVEGLLDGVQRHDTLLQGLGCQFSRLVRLADDDDASQLLQYFAHVGSFCWGLSLDRELD